MIYAHPRDLIEAAAAGGFSHCGIRLVAPRPGDPLVDVLNEPGGIGAIENKLRETGVKLLDIEAIWISPDTEVPRLRPALEAGARLGASHVLVVGNDNDAARLRANFAAICAMAEPLNLIVALEFITYCSVGSLDKAAAVVTDVGAPNGRLLIDALQFFRSGAAPADISAYDPALFAYMQICDGPIVAPASLEDRRTEARENRLLPGQGEFPLAALVDALPAGMPLSVEAPSRTLRGLDFREQGQVAGAALRKFLEVSDIKRRPV